MDAEYDEKYSKKTDWKRLGKLLLAIVGFIVMLVFLLSYFDEQDKAEQGIDITDEQIELLQEMNE